MNREKVNTKVSEFRYTCHQFQVSYLACLLDKLTRFTCFFTRYYFVKRTILRCIRVLANISNRLQARETHRKETHTHTLSQHTQKKICEKKTDRTKLSSERNLCKTVLQL